MRRISGTLLGAMAGFGFSTMGLIEVRDGFEFGGGNENTTEVIVAGVLIGAALGASLLWRYPLIIVGLIVGLATGIWLRDNLAFSGVQAPWVFLLLFGLPLVGAAIGYAIHKTRVVGSFSAARGGRKHA